MIGARWVCALLAAQLTIAGAPSAFAQDAKAAPRYAGRPVIDVLQELNRRGLRIVFSTAIVNPALRVATEPTGDAPREILDQVLRPHGLFAQPRANGVLVVARAPRQPARAVPIASPHATLRGRVVDAETELPLANVLVMAQRGNREVHTGSDGRFELAGLEPGSQSLYVSLVGYVLARPQVDVPHEGAAEILVPLTAGAGAYTEQLTVRADANGGPAAASPMQFTVRSAELQELRGVLADDPLRAMQTMPSASTGDDFRAEFSVRGSALRQMGFAIEGISTPWLVHAVQDVEDTGTISMINADVLESVTLSAGATAQLYGNRTGAWLDAAMREGSRDEVRVTGSLSGTGAAVVAEGPLGGARRGAWLVSARQSYIDWLLQRLESQEQSTFGFSDMHAKVVFDLDPRNQLQFSTVLGRSAYNERDESQTVNGTEVGRSKTGFAIGAWRTTVGQSLALTQRFALGGLRYRNSNDFGQHVGQGQAWSATYRSEVTMAPRPWMTVDGAWSLDREAAAVRRRQYSAVAGGIPVPRSDSTIEQRRWRHGGLVRARLMPTPPLAIDAGARLDHETLHQQDTISPWLLARWAPEGRWTLSAGAGRGHQFPELTQLPANAAAPLVAERARYADVSAAYQLSSAVYVQLSLYDRRESHGLRFDAPLPRLIRGALGTPPASNRWINDRTVSSRGAEIVVRRTAPAGLVGWVSYAYGRTRNTDASASAEYWGDFDQRHLLNVHASYRLSPRTNASARFRFGSNMPVPGYFAEQSGRLTLAATRNDLRLPAYARLDVRMDRTFHFTRRRLTLFAEVLNVLNRENVGNADGTVRSNGTVSGFVERLFPVLPSAGIRIEF